MFRLAQTVPDYLGVLVQVGGSPFDSAGPGSTDRIRMDLERGGPHYRDAIVHGCYRSCPFQQVKTDLDPRLYMTHNPRYE